MTIDYALRIYTDLLNNDEPIDLQMFKSDLSSDDYKEFMELISIIKTFKSIKVTKKFEDVFAKINDYKEELYSSPSVANFRTDKSAKEGEASKILDDLFEEEFGDD